MLSKELPLINQAIFNLYGVGRDVNYIDNISINSSKVNSSSLFLGLKGDNVDGSKYSLDAINNGASMAIVSNEIYQDSSKNIYYFGDIMAVLNSIASYARGKVQATYIGVTGSIGKTTVKDMLYEVLGQFSVTHKTQGNYNNHLGLPISLAGIPLNCDNGIFELGMNHSGEINNLTNILQPNIAIITDISNAHIENFNSIEAIADAKLEILNTHSSMDALFLNYDNPLYSYMLQRASTYNIKRIISFGSQGSADIYLESHRLIDNITFKSHVNILGESLSFESHLYSRHNAIYAALTLGVCKILGYNLNKALGNIINFKIPSGRGNISNVNINQQSGMLLDSSYNANPKSMIQTIKDFNNISQGKSLNIAVLGDIAEIGSEADKAYANIAQCLNSSNIDYVILFGNHIGSIGRDIKGSKVINCNDINIAKNHLNKIIDKPFNLLIKGSNCNKLSTLVNILTS